MPDVRDRLDSTLCPERCGCQVGATRPRQSFATTTPNPENGPSPRRVENADCHSTEAVARFFTRFLIFSAHDRTPIASTTWHGVESERLEGLSLLNHDDLVAAANNLPPLPPTVVQLSTLLDNPEYDIWDVVRVVELDATLVGKVMRLANAPCHGSGNVGSVRDAVARLGTGSVRSLAIAASVQPKLDADLSPFHLTPESYWRHSVAVLSFAEQMMAQGIGEFGNDFSTAALLHDFGKLLLVGHLRSEHVELLLHLDPTQAPVERESAVLGVNHAEVGAVVAQSWNLPSSLVRAIQYHHNPAECGSRMCHGLSIANQLAWRSDGNDSAYERESTKRAASLAAIGLTEEQLNMLENAGRERLQQTLDAYAL